MKNLIVSLFTLAFGAGILADDVQAARLGGGRSLGVQRQVTAPPKQATPPTQQQPATTPQPSGPGRWFAPLAGLAAGLGLGWLFAQGGFGPAIGALLMALFAGAVVFALMRLLSKRRAQGPQVQYAGFGNETVAAPPPSQLPGDAGVQPNYRGHLARLRQVTTEDMFNTLKGDVVAHSGAQQTDVVTLNAALLELVTEGGLHWASVRFSGSIREEANALAEPFEEIWHVRKPVTGSSGWLLAGIQQLS